MSKHTNDYIDNLKTEIRQKQYLVDLLESDRMMSRLRFDDMVLYKQYYKDRDAHYWLAEVKFKIRNWDKQARIRITLGNVDSVDPRTQQSRRTPCARHRTPGPKGEKN